MKKKSKNREKQNDGATNLFVLLLEVELVFEVLKMGCLNHLFEWPCMLIWRPVLFMRFMI